MQRAIYMDWNATAPVRPEAARAVLSALEDVGNPSSVHGFGRNARKLMEEARIKLASRVGAKVENVITAVPTNGATPPSPGSSTPVAAE